MYSKCRPLVLSNHNYYFESSLLALCFYFIHVCYIKSKFIIISNVWLKYMFFKNINFFHHLISFSSPSFDPFPHKSRQSHQTKRSSRYHQTRFSRKRNRTKQDTPTKTKHKRLKLQNVSFQPQAFFPYV